MKLFNYLKLFGGFTNAYQVIALAPEPSDRQEKKMLEEANKLLNAGWARKAEFLAKLEGKGEEVDYDAEKAKFFPAVVDGKLQMPLQYVQDYMVKKMAAVQNNNSIHDKQAVQDLQEVFADYGVTITSKFENLTLESIGWSAKLGQKPKVMVHAKDADGDDVCIRFEAAGELAQKFLNAICGLDPLVKKGVVFSLAVEAVDPAIERNKKAGKEVAKPGVYVNHNLKLTVAGKTHEGRPPQGERFTQKPTMEYMETLCNQAQHILEVK